MSRDNPPHAGSCSSSPAGPRVTISSGSPLEDQAAYARAVALGEWCFVSGTTGRDPGSGLMPEPVAQQAENAFDTISRALDEAGFALSDVVRATYYLVDAAHWPELMPVLKARLDEVRPAASCVVVKALVAPEMKVEIEVTAFRPGNNTPR